MKKNSAALALAAICFGLWTAIAAAQVAPAPPPPPPPPPPPVVGCGVACPAPSDPDDSSDSDSSLPVAQAQKGCGIKLGHLRAITAGKLRGVTDPELVQIIPVCRYKSLVGDDVKSELPAGNVIGLKPAIARNKAIATALAEDDYTAENVVGIVLAPKAALIYVFK